MWLCARVRPRDVALRARVRTWSAALRARERSHHGAACACARVRTRCTRACALGVWHCARVSARTTVQRALAHSQHGSACAPVVRLNTCALARNAALQIWGDVNGTTDGKNITVQMGTMVLARRSDPADFSEDEVSRSVFAFVSTNPYPGYSLGGDLLLLSTVFSADKSQADTVVPLVRSRVIVAQSGM